MKKTMFGLLASLLFVLPASAQVTQKAPQLVNVSCRGPLAANETVVAGIAIRAKPGAPLNPFKQVLIRGVGPGLSQFGVAGTLSDPKLILYQGQTKIAENDNWSGTAAETAVIDQVGAFRLSAGSRDAVISINLAVPSEGQTTYTVALSGAPGESGVGLIEVYDVQRDTGALELNNLSVLGSAGTGSNSFIVGFTFDGVGTKSVLVRAIGPELAGFGLSNFLSDPSLSFRYQSSPNQIVTLTNDNWSGADVANAQVRVGAFPLSAGSSSAALMPPIAVTGLTSATATVVPLSGSGRVLVEVYTVDL